MSEKKLSNPWSTGGGGTAFEIKVFAGYICLMATGGFAPYGPKPHRINRIKPQGRIEGYQTDDMIIFLTSEGGAEIRQLCQVKSSISFTDKDKEFADVMHAAWNDYRNPDVFTHNKDQILLIIGKLNWTDAHTIAWLLNHSRAADSSTDFFNRVTMLNYSPSKAGEKLKVIRTHLYNANGKMPLDDDDFFCFLRHMYLVGSDLVEDNGTVESLLLSHIRCTYNVSDYWGRCITLAINAIPFSGCIDYDKLPDDLVGAFPNKEQMSPPAYVAHPSAAALPFPAQDLASAILIGSWNEAQIGDVELIEQFIGKQYTQWRDNLRLLLDNPDNPLIFKGGIWTVHNRSVLLQEFGSKVFDDSLKSFIPLIKEVLLEKSQGLNLPPGIHLPVSSGSSSQRYSANLRAGLSETLAIVGNQSNLLTMCTPQLRDSFSATLVRDIYQAADHILLIDLQKEMPSLAEAAPELFLSFMEKLDESILDCMVKAARPHFFFKSIFDGFITALERLAWKPEHLSRSCLILARLARAEGLDEPKNYSLSSLIYILMPWAPQTLAACERRMGVGRALSSDAPEVAWHLLIRLLPGGGGFTMSTAKPLWMNVSIPEKMEEVPEEEYLRVVSEYAEILVEMATGQLGRIIELIPNADRLSVRAFEKLMNACSANEMISLEDGIKEELWSNLLFLMEKHLRFPGADWVLDETRLTLLEVTLEKVKPESALWRSKHLFSNRSYELHTDLTTRQTQSAAAVFMEGGLENIKKLAEIAETPYEVGAAFGAVAKDIDDYTLLSFFLAEKHTCKVFLGGYIQAKIKNDGWEWINQILLDTGSSWNEDDKLYVLFLLPFSQETWDLARLLSTSTEDKYWQQVYVRPFSAPNGLRHALDKLTIHNRPDEAVLCLHTLIGQRQLVSDDQIMTVLEMFRQHHDSIPVTLQYTINEIFKYLEENPISDQRRLIKLEWYYYDCIKEYPLPFMEVNTHNDGEEKVKVNRHRREPYAIERGLADEADFFVAVIKACYKPSTESNDGSPTGWWAKFMERAISLYRRIFNCDEGNAILNESDRIKAKNAYDLLSHWSVPPGLNTDGSFNSAVFSTWLAKVKELSGQSGHLKQALRQVGKVLIYVPSDADGFWIDRVVAKELNQVKADELRGGYRDKICYPNGARSIDPTGVKETREAESLRKKAQQADNAGYSHLAAMLNDAAGYIGSIPQRARDFTCGD